LNYQLLNKIKLLFSNYDNFKNELASELYNNIILNDTVNEVYDFDSVPPIKYLINKNMFSLEPYRAAQDINILIDLLDFNPTRIDYMMAHDKNVSSDRLQIKFNKNPTQNYVSHNNTINLVKNNNLTLFSLIRLKHLITIKNFLIPVNNDNQPQPVLQLLNIPSELLDISISNPYDNFYTYIYDRSYFKEKYCISITHNNINNIPVTTSYIPSSNLENLIYDLQYVLFISSMFPFHNSKYEKRIFRLLYFIKLNAFTSDYNNIYNNNYNIICDLMNTYIVREHDNNYTLTKNNNIGIINTIIQNYSINLPNYNINLYKLFKINTEYITFTELYTVIILFSELIITNTDESKLLLYNICKYNYNENKTINDFIINDNINGFYTDFTQKFILFIKTIKDKLEIINAHLLFRQ
jgi:hypothetical protein